MVYSNFGIAVIDNVNGMLTSATSPLVRLRE